MEGQGSARQGARGSKRTRGSSSGAPSTRRAAPRRALAFDVGMKTLAHALVEYKLPDDFAIDSLAVTDLLEYGGSRSTNCKKVPARLLTRYLIAYLSDNVEAWTKDALHVIVIEQQSRYGTKLRILGNVIDVFFQTYFRLNGTKCPPIVHQSGAQKLRVRLAGYRPRKLTKRRRTAIESNGGEKTEHILYRERKEYAIDNLLLLLAHYPRCRKHLAYARSIADKMDDVADAVLHAVFYLVMGRSTVPRGYSGMISLPLGEQGSDAEEVVNQPVVLDLLTEDEGTDADEDGDEDVLQYEYSEE